SKVWRALTDAQEFGKWFGAVFTEAFEPGARRRGKITQKGYEHMTMDVTIERMEPERLFSWRWHPGAAEPGETFSNEPTTLVVFELQEVPGGTLLTVVESGFDQIPLARREKAFRENDEGWAMQMKAIEDYLGRSS
ncbi:MAG: SRPBCC family protein, partial [Vicinamibacteria bacterium]